MTGARVVVVGAGAAGLATAAELAAAGAAVTVVEADNVATGSSGRSAGVFNRQTPNAIEQALRCFTVDVLTDMERAGELPLERTGYVRVAGDGLDLERLREAAERGRALGVTDARLIDAEELGRVVPGMKVDDLAGGLYCPSDGHLDGHLLCAAYLARARAHGAELRSRTRVVALELDRDGVRVLTTGEPLRCDVVVNAAGAWAAEVAALAGVELALVNQRHEIAIVHLPEPMDPPIPMVNTYVPGSARKGLYFRSEGRDRLIVGSHAHEVLPAHAVAGPDDYERQVTFEFLEEMAAGLTHRLPEWHGLRLEPGWTGLYPTSPDALPQVGPHGAAPHLVTVGGLDGTGLTLSAAVGRLAAEWALDGEGHAFDFADALLPDRPSLAPGATGSQPGEHPA
jgi:sarcosine oxidase subunit beta